MSSSPRQASPPDALIKNRGPEAAPIRLPLAARAEFVHEFNATYGSIGLQLEPCESSRLVPLPAVRQAA